jgi:hypothetical protein
MDPGEIEFVAAAPVVNGPGEEVLDVGHDRRRAPRWLQLGGLGIALVALVVWVATRSNGSSGPAPVAESPSAQSPSAESSVGAQSPTPVAVVPVTVEPVPGSAPPLAPVWVVKCAAPAACSPATSAQNSVLEAIVAYLPSAQLASVHTTVTLEHGTQQALSERILDARVGPADLLVRIRPYLHPVQAPTVGISPTPPGLGSAFFHIETAAYVIDVQWTGTTATPPPSSALLDLAHDPRLEAL